MNMFRQQKSLASLLVFYISIQQVLSQDCPHKGLTYTILPAGNPELALDAYDPDELHLYIYLGDGDQTWQLICGYKNTINIFHPKTGKFLDASSNRLEWPKPAILGIKDDTGYQDWTFIDGELNNPYSHLSLNVSTNILVIGTVVGVAPSNGTMNQQWILWPSNPFPQSTSVKTVDKYAATKIQNRNEELGKVNETNSIKHT